jgi:hypothetical protein
MPAAGADLKSTPVNQKRSIGDYKSPVCGVRFEMMEMYLE